MPKTWEVYFYYLKWSHQMKKENIKAWKTIALNYRNTIMATLPTVNI